MELDKSLNDKHANEFLNWMSEHKFFVIIMLILIVLGLGRIAKHFSKHIDKYIER